MTRKETKEKIQAYIKLIPPFIEMANEDHYMIYQNIKRIFKLYNIAIINYMFSNQEIEELNTDYYHSLLNIWNADKKIYPQVAEYIGDLYENILEELEYENEYESAYNLYHLVNLGTVIDPNINENESE